MASIKQLYRSFLTWAGGIWRSRSADRPLTAGECIIVGEPAAPLFELRPIEWEECSSPVPSGGLPSGVKTTFAAVLQQIPGLGQSVRGAIPAYRVLFSPETMKGLQNGTLELVKSAGSSLPVARNVATGQFVSTGRVVQLGGQGLAIATAAWQVAAMITAQHFLAEIDAKLARIEGKLDEILHLIDSQMRGQLAAAMQMLAQYSETVKAGSLTEEDMQTICTKLEDFEHLCLSLIETAEREMAKREAEIRSLNPGWFWKREDSHITINNQISDWRNAAELFLTACLVRTANCSIRSLLPVTCSLVARRLEDTMRRLGAIEIRTSDFEASVTDAAKELGKHHYFQDDRRKPILKKCRQNRDAVLEFTASLAQQNKVAQGAANDPLLLNDQPLALDIRLDHKGEVIDVRRAVMSSGDLRRQPKEQDFRCE